MAHGAEMKEEPETFEKSKTSRQRAPNLGAKTEETDAFKNYMVLNHGSQIRLNLS